MSGRPAPRRFAHHLGGRVQIGIASRDERHKRLAAVGFQAGEKLIDWVHALIG